MDERQLRSRILGLAGAGEGAHIAERMENIMKACLGINRDRMPENSIGEIMDNDGNEQCK